MGGHNDVLIISSKLEGGMLQEAPMPTLDLIVEDFKRREMDLVIEYDSNEFISDDDFVKS